MAEREQSHRHGFGDELIRREFQLRTTGQWLAMLALVLLLGAVCWLAFLGDTKAAAALGSATIVGVVAIFVTGKFFDSKELSSQPKQQHDEPKPKPNVPVRRQGNQKGARR